MDEANVVVRERYRRSFWVKAREGKDLLLLYVGILFIGLLLVAMVLTSVFFNDMAAVLTANQIVLLLIGVLAETVLFVKTIYRVLVLVRQIEERE